MAKVKRQYTRWIYKALYGDNGKGGIVLVGYIYNKNDGIPRDVIRLLIINRDKEKFNINCRLDEAVVIAAGLNKIAAQMLIEQLPIPKGRGENEGG